MAQIKLSIAFVLAAAALTHVVAQPISGTGSELCGDHPNHPHHPHPHRFNIPERLKQETTFETPSELSPREFEDLFDRDDSENGNSGANSLPSTPSSDFVHKESFHSGPHSGFGSRTSHPRKGVPHRGPAITRPRYGLPRQPRWHGLPTISDHIGVPMVNYRQGRTVRRHEHVGPIAAREYAEFDDMFEREVTENVNSGSESLPSTPSHFSHKRPFNSLGPKRVNFGHGPESFHPRIGVPLGRPYNGLRPRIGGPYRPFHDHGPVIHPGFGAPYRPYFGHGPVVHPRIGVVKPHRPNFGPGPVVLRNEPVKSEVSAREYTESDDMFERDFKDDELDAREFDDEHYLD